MSWLAILAAAIGLYLAYKLIGTVVKIGLWVVVLVGAYWFFAPMAGWPGLGEVVGSILQ